MEKPKINFKKCELCGEEAKSLCLQCISYFCVECYKYVHSKKQNIQHKEEKIDYYVPIDIKCPEHPKNINNLFCVDEQGNIIFNNYL